MHIATRALAAGLFASACYSQPVSGHADRGASVGRARELAAEVLITRDGFGIPHVRAKTDAGAVFGGLYARAEDEMLRIELGHAQSIGMAAAISGPAGIAWDRVVHAYEIPRRAREQYQACGPDVRALVDAAADALNYYLDRHPEYRPRVIHTWEPWMFIAREYTWAVYHAGQELQRQLAAPAAPPAEVPGAVDGSNAWALHRSRTSSGHAMLYLNPHIPLDEPYELHLSSDEGLAISGMVAYGAGLLPMAGYNRHLGWSLTVNYPDIADSYLVRFDDPDDPAAYRHGDAIRRSESWSVEIDVREGDASRKQTIELSRTHHGPILWRRGNTAYAVRVPRIEDQRCTEQWYRMAKAATKDEWIAAVSMCNVAFHNLVYADDQGNIGYIYYAAFPRRDPTLSYAGLVDGSDPRADWQGYHTLDEIPQVWNPPAGYVLNTNSPPASVTAPGEGIDPGRYPPYMIGQDPVDGRLAMAHRQVGRAEKWTLDDLERAAFDTTVHSAAVSIPALVRDLDAARTINPSLAERVVPAVELLGAWDHRLAADSAASTLFMLWAERIFEPAWRSRRSPGDLCSALAQVMDELAATFNGAWQVPWGDVNRHQRFDTSAGLAVSDDRASLPIVGGHGGLGVGFCYLARGAQPPNAASARRYGYHGHSFVGAVEFTPSGPIARAIIPFGQSRDPGSPHFADQAPIYASGRLRPALFDGDEIAASAGRRYRPGE
ncbi:MAG: 7-beta-(4-carbaxybutanamido)cephalosporanic acid acylase [Phycisphaerae bacterium]